jgi:hypothetical protein
MYIQEFCGVFLIVYNIRMCVHAFAFYLKVLVGKY